MVKSQPAPAQSDTDEKVVKYPATKAALCERAAAHVEMVADEHFPESPVETINWETSTWMHALPAS